MLTGQGLARLVLVTAGVNAAHAMGSGHVSAWSIVALAVVVDALRRS
jgi:hypothetical protein